MANKKVSLKLLVDKQNGRVLFAESGKDFVDFLFTILTLPLGTVVKLLSKSSMVGSVGKLYESVENLNQNYMQPRQTKDNLLCPKTSHMNPKTPLLPTDSDNSALKFYNCSKCNGYNYTHVSSSPEAICPICRLCMSRPMSYVAPPPVTGVANSTGIGYVKEMVTYMIEDDLEVRPMSNISAIALLNAFNIEDFGALEEKVVDVGMDQALDLLEASLESHTVLTDVFLRKKEYSDIE